MGAVWIWFLIAIVFGVSAGLIFHFALRKGHNKLSNEEDKLEGDSEESRSGNMLLTIFIFTIIGFLIVWLVWALLGLNMCC